MTDIIVKRFGWPLVGTLLFKCSPFTISQPTAAALVGRVWASGGTGGLFVDVFSILWFV